MTRYLGIWPSTSASYVGPVAANGVYLLGLELSLEEGSVLALRFGLVVHWPLDSARTARWMRPVLSWKNNCRSPLERIIAARDVSLRIY